VYAGRYSQYRGRSHGRPLGGLPLRRLLGYLQNHDQVGNRAFGDRIGRSLSVEQVELAAALVLTGPFVPLLFQGEEWNASSPFQYFTDHQDSALASAVREGRSREFKERGEAPEGVPDPQAAATFEASKLDWAELELPEQRRVLAWYRALIRLRRSEPGLSWGSEPVLVDSDETESRWLTLRSGALLLAANFSAGALGVPGVRGAELLLGSRGVEQRGDELGLPAWGVGILRRPT
jgi:maltooligosyltrehalose trehalohydrolase